jgi:hypothetical protein
MLGVLESAAETASEPLSLAHAHELIEDVQAAYPGQFGVVVDDLPLEPAAVRLEARAEPQPAQPRRLVESVREAAPQPPSEAKMLFELLLAITETLDNLDQWQSYARAAFEVPALQEHVEVLAQWRDALQQGDLRCREALYIKRRHVPAAWRSQFKSNPGDDADKLIGHLQRHCAFFDSYFRIKGMNDLALPYWSRAAAESLLVLSWKDTTMRISVDRVQHAATPPGLALAPVGRLQLQTPILAMLEHRPVAALDEQTPSPGIPNAGMTQVHGVDQAHPGEAVALMREEAPQAEARVVAHEPCLPSADVIELIPAGIEAHAVSDHDLILRAVSGRRAAL